MSVIRLSPAVQTYAWGKRGTASAVARLAHVDPVLADTPYAELWLGTHASGAARVVASGQLLSQWIVEQGVERVLGARCAALYGDGQLPFLFKVLSVAQALSIQAHPDSVRAPLLHASNPTQYKDPYHKPEMAIALTDFQALCGFRPVAELLAQLDATPELAVALGSAAVAQLRAAHGDDELERAALALALRHLMNMPDADVAALLSKLVSRIQSESQPSDAGRAELLLRLHAAYPGDVGVLCSLLLNYTTLRPGEGVFLGANEPHAYLLGDCIECMACSDNVVRAGLTPKFKDKETLVDMLTYNRGPVAVLGGAADASGSVRSYASPVPEFSVTRVDVAAGQTHRLAARVGPSIAILVNGTGRLGALDCCRPGSAAFIAHQTAVDLVATEALTVYVASSNLS
jgi:mannose-6-phosphate isomerase